MRGSGSAISNTGGDMRPFKMDVPLQDFMSMGNRKVWGISNGQMDSFMKESGYVASNTVLECGAEPRATIMLGSGNSIKLMEWGYMSGSMETDMRGNSEKVSKTAKVYRNLPMEISTRALSTWENLTVTVNTSGPTAVFTKAISETVSGTAVEPGRRILSTLINTKENT